MKQHNLQHKFSIIKVALVLIVIFLLNSNFIFSQQHCILSPLKPLPDTAYYNPSGAMYGGGTYNVLTNDLRNICNTTNNNVTTTPLLINSLNQNQITGSATTPFNYFTISSTGNINVNIGLGPIPLGSYVLTYMVCETGSTICVTQTVTIYVYNFRLASPLKSKSISSNAHTILKNAYQIINFPDANLKAKLLDSATCYNTTNGDFILVDANGDGEIDTNEALQIGRVNISNANISNLTGLEYFTNLTSLGAPLNNITSYGIIISSLQILALWENPLVNLNINSLLNLTGLGLLNTDLTSLSISNNNLLTHLDIAGTNINNLDVGICHNLTNLYCKNNPNLTNINIKNTSSLDYGNTLMQQDCWLNCPNLNNICADSFEIPALQSFLAGCGVNTSGININSNCALGVESNELLAGVSVSPNPSSGIFEITFGATLTVKTTLTVYNVLGQEVLSQECAMEDKTLVDLTDYADGVYVMQLKMGDRMVNKKIVKE